MSTSTEDASVCSNLVATFTPVAAISRLENSTFDRWDGDNFENSQIRTGALLATSACHTRHPNLKPPTRFTY